MNASHWIIIFGCISSAVVGAWGWDRLMKYELARRGYGRWNPQNRRWQWITKTGFERTGFFG